MQRSEIVERASRTLSERRDGAKSEARTLAYRLRDRLDLTYESERSASTLQGGKGVEVETASGETLRVTASPMETAPGRSGRASSYGFTVEVGGETFKEQATAARHVVDVFASRLEGAL